MYKETFQQIGLNKKEAVIYETILQTGPIGAKEILKKVSKKIETTRSNLYNILAALKEKDLLIEKAKKGKNLFEAKSPIHLLKIFEDFSKKVDRAQKNLTIAMPELKSLYNLTTNKPVIQFFEGLEGFREALWDSLSSKETILTYSDIQSVKKYQKDINAEYVAERMRLGLKKKILSMDTPFARKHYKKKDMRLTRVRFLPKELKVFETAMQLYDNKVCYYTLRKENMISVIIEDHSLYEMNRNIFEYLWQIA